MPDRPQSSANAAPGRANTPPPPRAFAQGTGLVLQAAGVGLFLISCCLCPATGAWEPLWTRAETIDHLSSDAAIGVPASGLWEQPARAGMMLSVGFTLVGGLALAVLGLGLQADRAAAAWGAVFTCGLMLAVMGTAWLGLWKGGAPTTFMIWHGVASAVVVAVTGFSMQALRQVRAFPPPPNIDILPADYQVPYSHYHQDPPEVRLQRELEAKRRAQTPPLGDDSPGGDAGS